VDNFSIDQDLVTYLNGVTHRGLVPACCHLRFSAATTVFFHVDACSPCGDSKIISNLRAAGLGLRLKSEIRTRTKEIVTFLKCFFVFMQNGSWPSSSGLRGHRRTYLTILESACQFLNNMVCPPATSKAGARGPRSIWHKHKTGQFLSHDSDS
jgi:hypothetical protein